MRQKWTEMAMYLSPAAVFALLRLRGSSTQLSLGFMQLGFNSMQLLLSFPQGFLEMFFSP